MIITVFIPWTPNILFQQSQKIVQEPGLTMKTLQIVRLKPTLLTGH